MTPTQMAMAHDLERQYGKADLVLTNSDSIYLRGEVLVMLVWHEQNRCLIILPNGGKLSWTPVTI